ncbi:MAG TPA: LapA family protein [Micromonosporaceae bacterium]|nr:LapA family protein [Micromonosporaceae bacterium]
MVSNAPPPRPTDPTTTQPFGQTTDFSTGAVQRQQRTRRRVPGKLIVGLVVFAIALWFILANRQDANIRFWVHTVSAPVWLVLLVTFVVGIAFGFFLRRRRPKGSRGD